MSVLNLNIHNRKSNKQVFLSLEFVNILLQMEAKAVKMRLHFFNSAVIYSELENGLFYPRQLEPCYKRVTSREKNRVLKSETLNTIDSILSL